MPAAKNDVAAVFRLGEYVEISYSAGTIGKIIELRGPLGPGGVDVYRVLLARKPRRRYVEVLGEQLKVVPKPPRPTA